ncbi:pyroglutamyl-peptidase [Aureococcus anophagefferens]|nr:pyroglutamyl-peptidase [Aureococcus anophagefferens]
MPRVHWTGFGKFHGVADNPSATLAEQVAAKFADDSWEVVEVSGEAARDAALNGATPTSSSTSASPWTTRTSRSSAAPTTTRRSAATASGWRRRAKISADSPFGAPSPTPLDVEAAAAKAKDLGFSVDVSDDAGRFVCNYLYYCSLERRPCVFVHVPSFDKLGLEDQLATLEVLRSGLLDAAAAAAAPPPPAAESTADEVVEDLVAMGIDAAMARQAAAAGCTSVETAMEFIFSEPPAMPPPPPSAQRLKQVLVVATWA